ncbi:hypothetical protein [Microbispora sp. H13382]|uniref:hypothetical protein n=1 Tax=Microbispora sp. H13382 TaxID=2729112 RepID=UPI001600FBDF|nr:hypothetical protein [Microbispora sp. H13382]
MIGVIGVDAQRSRTCVVLGETGRADGIVETRLTSVGDGCRHLVPNACAPGMWGSVAAEAQPDGWPVDPWSDGFLRGLRDRLWSYLGRVPPDLEQGYQVSVVLPPAGRDSAPPGGAVSADAVRARFAAAGMPGATIVDPAEALVCRWLAEPSALPYAGHVVAVACGETWTAVAVYRVTRGEDAGGGGPRISRLSTVPVHAAHGSGAWCAELVRRVTERCAGERVSPLVMADGVLEFGARLRGRDAIRPLEWTGPHAARLYTPLRLSRAELSSWESVRLITDELSGMVHAAGLPPRQTALVLLGGVGAVWPWYADALRQFGQIWQSNEPERDLAAGAVHFPELRTQLAEAPTFRPASPRSLVEHEPGETGAQGDEAGAAAPAVDASELPPWLRRREDR